MIAALRSPVVLDLFCGAGGATRGYQRAGFQVHGFDIRKQPHYCGEAFTQLDALLVLDELLLSRVLRAQVSLIHASPPCQAYSDLQKRTGGSYPKLIEPVRERLQQIGLPYIIENVEGAPLVNPVKLCGASPIFPGVRVIRHRLFESNLPLQGAPCPEKHPLVFTHDKRKAHYGKLDQATSYVQVTGGGNCTVANKRAAMGIDWMNGRELNESIPPAYTEYLGWQVWERVVQA